ncbi:hypothetical protein ATKI12_5856 [Kitasatospora sp. Ki12]
MRAPVRRGVGRRGGTAGNGCARQVYATPGRRPPCPRGPPGGHWHIPTLPSGVTPAPASALVKRD